MSWGKVDDRFVEHPKVVRLERKGARAWADSLATWLVVLCYANRNETDGEIDEVLLARSTPLGKDAVKAAQHMVDAGLMVRTTSGFRLHDFGKYNPLRAAKEAERQADRDRKAAGKAGGRPKGIRSDSDRNATGFQSESVRIPKPPSRPDPAPEIQPGSLGVDQAPAVPASTGVAGPSRAHDAEQVRRGFVRAYVDAQQTPPPVTKNLDGKPWHSLVDFARDAVQRSGLTLEEVGQRLGRGALGRKRFSFSWLVDNPSEFFETAPANTLGGGETVDDLISDLRTGG